MSDPTPTVRERVIRWDDPMETVKDLRALPGLEAIRAIMAGDVNAPPVAHLLGFGISLAEEGKVRVTLVPNESHYNVLGMVHGGIIATLLDTAVGCAVQTILPFGRTYTTLNLSVSYIRAVTIGSGGITAEGTLVHAGRTTAIAHGRVVDASGKLFATAESTCLLMDTPRQGGVGEVVASPTSSRRS